MKIKPILCSMAALSMLAGMTSCSNEEGVKMPDVETGAVDLSNAESFVMKVGMPASEMKTRAGENPSLTYGDDGLYQFNRTIDHLWYAVYNNGELLYTSMQPGVPQAVYDANNKDFALRLQIPKIDGEVKLEDYKVLFFAGNEADKIGTSEITDGVGLDFENKTMYAYPTMLNKTTLSGKMYDPTQYDYFVKYVTLKDIVDADFNGSVTLTRPFAQVSLLTDELCQPTILSAYSSTGEVAVATTPSVATTKGQTVDSTLPYAWNYDTDEILTKNISSLNFLLNANALNNAEGTYSIPQELTFKERKMFCVASYMMLAPDARKAYDASATANKFAFALNVSGDRNQTDASVAADMPTGGFKANEKYVIYNKKASGGDPTDPDNPGGTGGILSNHYILDIVVDPAWENSVETGF